MMHCSSSQLHCASHMYSVGQRASSAATCALQLRRRHSLHAALPEAAPMLPSGSGAASGGVLQERIEVATRRSLLHAEHSSSKTTVRT
jgi:hypothetical protein